MYMTPDELRSKIELQIVELIKAKLADGTMTEERSQAVAQHALDSLKPGMSFEELYKAISKLDDLYTELAPVVLPIVREYEDTIVRQTENHVRELIRQGQYDAAEKLAKNVISKDVKIVWQGSGRPSQESEASSTSQSPQ